MKKSYYHTLDAFRGIAALAVVFFHCGVIPFFEGTVFEPFIVYGELGVPFFFVISGYVIYQSADLRASHSKQATLDFVKRRFWRIYPVFWASLLFSFLISTAVMGNTYSGYDLLANSVLVAGPLHLALPQNVYWTLEIEQQFYIIMALLILPVFSKYRVWFLMASTAVALIAPLSLMSNFWVNALITRWWIGFLLGICLFMIINRKPYSAIWSMILVVLVGTGFISGNVRYMFASLAAIIILLAHPFDNRISDNYFAKPLFWLGSISYSLYVTHSPVLWLFRKITEGWLDQQSPLVYFASIATTLLVAYGFYLLVEKRFISSSRQRKNVEQVSHHTIAQEVSDVT